MKSVEIIRAASSRDFMVEAAMGSRSPGHHSAALTSCLPQLSVHLPVPEQPSSNPSGSLPCDRRQSLTLTLHLLFKWVWAGMATLSHSSCLFSERKSIFHRSCLLQLARQQKCEAGRAVPAWPGQAGVEDLGCLGAIVIQGVQPVPGKQESCSGRK